jgi:subtilisin family serine protease
MTNILRSFCAALAFMILGAAAASAGQKIVTFDPSFKAGERVKVVQSVGGKVLKEFHIIEALVAVFPDSVKNANIYSLKGVRNVEEDRYLKWIEETAEPLPLTSVSDGVGLIKDGEFDFPAPVPGKPVITPEEKEIPWGVKRVNAAGAWTAAAGAGVRVAVIDTGMDYKHPDLAANYGGGYNAVSTSTLPMDDHGHGTHVSGTIGAVRDAKGVVGVAPKVTLYAVKVLDAGGSGTYSNIVDGIQWSVDNKMQVINMSLGGGSGTDSLKKVMEIADQAGVTIVCAAGNDSGPVNFPAKYPQAIAVSASDSADRIASFSSRGPEIAFIAPGVNIYSSYKGGAYKTMSGTSMASPHVAGLAALAAAFGADTPAKVRAALQNASTRLGLKPGEEGAGMINAAKLISSMKTQ